MDYNKRNYTGGLKCLLGSSRIVDKTFFYGVVKTETGKKKSFFLVSYIKFSYSCQRKRQEMRRNFE